MATVSKFAVSVVAKLRGVRGEVKTQAEIVASRAEGIFASHDHPGGAKITTSRGSKSDYFANLDDPDGAAIPIEFGGTRRDGTPFEGLHVMRKAARA